MFDLKFFTSLQAHCNVNEFMWKNTLYPNGYSPVLGITECDTASCMYVGLVYISLHYT